MQLDCILIFIAAFGLRNVECLG